MTDLLELAARCEAATGPDRELDCEIAVAALGYERDGTDLYHKGERYSIREPEYYDLEGQNCELRCFTASIDAAMTLVPEGYAIHLETAAGCSVVYANVWNDEPDYDGTAPNETRAATLSLALCAAALRARSEAAAVGGR